MSMEKRLANSPRPIQKPSRTSTMEKKIRKER